LDLGRLEGGDAGDKGGREERGHRAWCVCWNAARATASIRDEIYARDSATSEGGGKIGHAASTRDTSADRDRRRRRRDDATRRAPGRARVEAATGGDDDGGDVAKVMGVRRARDFECASRAPRVRRDTATRRGAAWRGVGV
jgi:hypothetical protein